jgi:serine/threonine protein phosphatase PrpC
VRLVSACGGQCALYTRRSPFKDTSNQDVAAVVPCSRDAGAIVVADGLGGLLSGEVAAEIAVSSIRKSVERLGESPRRGTSRSNSAEQTTADELRTAILEGLNLANERVLSETWGSATTIAIVEIMNDRIRSYHVGDSMVLVCGLRGKLKHLTVCHSPVGFLVKAGLIDEDEAMHHEERHLVSNVIGAPDMEIETGPELQMAARDTVLVATDGLFDNLHVAEIVERIRKGPLDEGVERLARDATERMLHPVPGLPSKPDDLTIVAFRLSR